MKKIYLIAAIFILVLLKSKAQTVTDIDGNIYNTVTIGTQTWMKENLKVTHYRNGDTIPNVKDSLAWQILSTGAYCNYKNDSSYVPIYGRLYNWYAVDDSRNLCPTGWHVPTDEEWCILENFIEPNTDSSCNQIGWRGINTGGKMKDTGTVFWTTPNNGATNESGFTALPGGMRVDYGNFIPLGHYGTFWSKTEYNSPNACFHGFNWVYAKIARGFDSKNNGYSVRCIKDSTTAQIYNIDTKEKFNIYPNPAKEKITIENSEKQILSLSIYNLVGNLILQKKLTYGTNEIGINSLLTGVYIIKIVGGNRIIQQRLIKL